MIAEGVANGGERQSDMGRTGRQTISVSGSRWKQMAKWSMVKRQTKQTSNGTNGQMVKRNKQKLAKGELHSATSGYQQRKSKAKEDFFVESQYPQTGEYDKEIVFPVTLATARLEVNYSTTWRLRYASSLAPACHFSQNILHARP